ncbi:MAG: hypothetical protein ABI002_08550 [Saprospiraceae bacterium]
MQNKKKSLFRSYNLHKASLLLITIINLCSCKYYTKNWCLPEVGTLLWVTETLTDTAIKLAVTKTLETSTIIIAQVSWSPNDRNFFDNAEWYHSLATDHGKSFMLNVDWLENDRSTTRGGWSFQNEQIRQTFYTDIHKLVEKYHPDYLTLGIEVNYYALTNADGYREFVKCFNQIKASLKKQNPKLKIGLSFQLQLLYGIHSDWAQNRSLPALDAVVENLDYIGVSLYQDVQISKIPSLLYSLNYLDSLATNYRKPIGITETGISSKTFNDKQRADYINAIYQKFTDLDLKFLIWGSIIDNPKNENWQNEIGLLYSNGTEKPEFKIWQTRNLKIIR